MRILASGQLPKIGNSWLQVFDCNEEMGIAAPEQHVFYYERIRQVYEAERN